METSEVTDEGTDAPSGDDASSVGRGRKVRDAIEERKLTDSERATEIAERARANGTARAASEVVTRKVDPAKLQREAEQARQRRVGEVRPPEPTPETPEPRRPRQPSPPAASKGAGAKPGQAQGKGPDPAPATESGGVKTKTCKRCGEPFELKRSNQQYHPECGEAQKRERKNAEHRAAYARKRDAEKPPKPVDGPEAQVLAPKPERTEMAPVPLAARSRPPVGVELRQRYIDMLFRIAESDEADWLRRKDALDRLERLTS